MVLGAKSRGNIEISWHVTFGVETRLCRGSNPRLALGGFDQPRSPTAWDPTYTCLDSSCLRNLASGMASW
jgi:hypothetical protein